MLHNKKFSYQKKAVKKKLRNKNMHKVQKTAIWQKSFLNSNYFQSKWNIFT